MENIKKVNPQQIKSIRKKTVLLSIDTDSHKKLKKMAEEKGWKFKPFAEKILEDSINE